MRKIYLLLLPVFIYACGPTPENISVETSAIPFEIREMTDEEYPDNPDIGFRSSDYGFDYFSGGSVTLKDSLTGDFRFIANSGDTILVADIDLREFIPTIPNHLRGKDEYLSYISVVNQEWNRNQVRFGKDYFTSTDANIVRVDIARNCLNAYLWEVILYTEEDGKQLPIYHGWFDFPHLEYQMLFNQVNEVPFDKYGGAMEQWVDPEQHLVDLEMLRKQEGDVVISYEDLSDNMYPLAGAREKKFKEIIWPENFETMRDLQNDSTLFATFTPPGYYNRADPRKTELGRFIQLDTMMLSLSESKANGQSGLWDIELVFSDTSRTTHLIFGGINPTTIPALDPKDANSGWKSSMGIGNHPFYETYEEHIKLHTSTNAYYALLTDGAGQWIDSHEVGIDGPILHFDKDHPTILHIWLLSFERHALVGHYTLETME